MVYECSYEFLDFPTSPSLKWKVSVSTCSGDRLALFCEFLFCFNWVNVVECKETGSCQLCKCAEVFLIFLPPTEGVFFFGICGSENEIYTSESFGPPGIPLLHSGCLFQTGGGYVALTYPLSSSLEQWHCFSYPHCPVSFASVIGRTSTLSTFTCT